MPIANPFRRAAAWLVPLAGLLAAPAFATGPTGEEDTWADLHFGSYALATLPPDARRVVYVDHDGRLVREAIDPAADDPAVALPLPWHVGALSASNGAERVALQTVDGCSVLVDFAALAALERAIQAGVPQRPTIARWLARVVAWPRALMLALARPPLRILADAGDPGRPSDMACRRTSAQETPGPRYEFRAIALSPDGHRVALDFGAVLDLDTPATPGANPTARVLQRVPTGGAVAELRFVDDGKKLLAVQAVLGEHYESAPDPSDMQFALWDLERGELFNLVHTQPRGSLGQHDFLWDFSADGRVRVLSPLTKSAADGARVLDIDLARCGAGAVSLLRLPPGEWAGFAVDPRGRWVAVAADPPLDERTSRPKGPAEVLLFVPDDETPRQRWTSDEALRALRVAPDGRSLLATTRSTRVVAPDGSETLRGGGVLKRFVLDPDVLGLPPSNAFVGDVAPCRIEDERAGARTIALDARAHATAFTLDVTAPNLPPAAEDARVTLNDHYAEIARTWGVTPDGALWVDRYATLERIDPADGHVLGRIDTPRSAQDFATVLYERSAFLRGADGAVELVPFDAHGRGAAQPFVRKPGFRAQRVEIKSGRALVRWVDDRIAPPHMRENGDVVDNTADGSGIGVLYDLATGAQLFEYPGILTDAGVMLQAEIDDPESFNDLFAPDGVAAPVPAAASARFEWSLSYMNSMRAQVRSPSGHAAATVLWDGLRVNEPSVLQPEILRVLPLADGALAVVARQADAIVYDAERHRRSAPLPLFNVTEAAALPAAHRLLLEQDRRLIAIDFD